MLSPLNRKVALGIVAAAGLVAALWYVLVPVESMSESRHPDPIESARTPAPIDSPGLQPPLVVAASPGPPPEDGKGWFPTDTMSTVSEHYRAMRDKRRFVDLALKTGGGAYLAFVLAADGRCQPVSGKPGTIAAHRRRLESTENPTVRQQAVARLHDGCEGFELRPLGEMEMLPFLTTLLGASDPAARALRLLKEQDPEKIRREAASLLGEGDLSLVAVVADSISRIALPPLQEGPAGSGAPSLHRLASYVERKEADSAWTLALCRMGVECQKDESSAWFSACYDDGHCGDDFIEAQQRASHKARFDAVYARSLVLEKAIRDRNWRSLGF